MGAVVTTKAGGGIHRKDLGSGRARWGDYGAASIDPVNGLSLWTIQECAESPVGLGTSDDRFGTWWAEFGVEPCVTHEMIVNGSFETGTFLPWTTTANGSGGRDADWTRSTLGRATGCIAAPNPIDGPLAAYDSLDGALASIGTARERLFPAGTAIPGPGAWIERSADVAAFLQGRAGETLTLRFRMAISESATGPAGFGLDPVSLRVTACRADLECPPDLTRECDGTPADLTFDVDADPGET